MSISPNANAILDVHPEGSEITAVVVTASIDWFNDDKIRYDFVSRYFAPWAGIVEDPATGSLILLISCYCNDTLYRIGALWTGTIVGANHREQPIARREYKAVSKNICLYVCSLVFSISGISRSWR
jgi:hypothetical protein